MGVTLITIQEMDGPEEALEDYEIYLGKNDGADYDMKMCLRDASRVSSEGDRGTGVSL